MNERISLLALKASNPETGWLDRQKFAELIVKECAQVVNDSNQSKNRAPGVSVGDVVRKHFGV